MVFKRKRRPGVLIQLRAGTFRGDAFSDSGGSRNPGCLIARDARLRPDFGRVKIRRCGLGRVPAHMKN